MIEHTPTSCQRHHDQDDVKALRGNDASRYTSTTVTSTIGATTAASACVPCSSQDSASDSGDFDGDRSSEADRRDQGYSVAIVSVVVHEVGITIISLAWSNGTRAFVKRTSPPPE
ncbi:unnamed protein product [Sphacelaria rigidula]